MVKPEKYQKIRTAQGEICFPLESITDKKQESEIPLVLQYSLYPE